MWPLFLGFGFLVSCVGSEGRPPEPQEAPNPARFVVFSETRMMLTELETPTVLPVTVGSSPGPDLIQSDVPSVADVDSSGRLVGHRPGRTVLRTKSGASPLIVDVRPLQKLRVVPPAVALTPGQRAVLQVLAQDEPLQPNDVQWQMSDPAVASVVGSEVVAGSPGDAIVVAVRGAIRVEVPVSVKPAVAVPLRTTPSSLVVAVDETVTLATTAPAGAAVQWVTSDQGVVRPIGAGRFVARHPGKARVCAAVSGEQGCTDIQVRVR
jgi:hypothetical protein